MAKLSVTQILWRIFPFDNKYFLLSLSKAWIDKKRVTGMIKQWWIADVAGELDYDNLMWMLSQFGTIIHQAAYDLWTIWFTSLKKWTICEKHIKSLIDYFESNKVKALKGEIYIECEEFRWISDWLYWINWRLWLLDFKTFGAYKYIYWIEDTIEYDKQWKVKLAKHDAEKVPVQLWMYDYWLQSNPLLDWLSIQHYWVLWITENGCFLIEVQPNIKPYLDWRDAQGSTKKLSIYI